MCYKILNDKNTHFVAWNEILTQFGECNSLTTQFAQLLSQAHMLKINQDQISTLTCALICD